MARGQRALLAMAGFAFALATSRTSLALDGARLPTQHMQDAWSEREGLPQNSVKAIAQTFDGMLWIGTEEGLVRFDGASFVVLDRATSKGRTTNVVLGLAVTHGGIFLLGGRDGLCKLEGTDFSCEALPDGARGERLRAAGERLFVATDRGLFVREAAGGLRREPAIASAVRDVATSSDGRVVWAVTADEGAVVVENGKKTVIDLGGLAPDDITSVSRLSRGPWFGTKQGPRTLGDARLERAPYMHVPKGNIRFVLEDRDGTIWMSVFDDGLYRTQGHDIVRVPLAAGQTTERLDTAFEDDAGGLWIGSRLSGLHRLRDGPFVPWGAPEGIAHGFVHSVLADDHGRVFVAAAGGGAYVVQDGVARHLGRTEGLPEEGVDALAIGRGKSVLFGTHGGVFRIGTESVPHAELVPSTKGVDATSILEEEHELWVGTPKGLFAAHTGRRWGTADGLPSTWIGPLLRARDGALWIGTDVGIARMRADRIDLPLHARLPRTGASSFFETSDGSILIGTPDAGLAVVAGERITILGRGAGLYDDTVHAIVDDGAGGLWSSCNKGPYATSFAEIDAVVRGERTTLESRAWGRESGLRSRECNGGNPGATRAKDGTIWFATMAGVAAIHPGALKSPAPPRTPVLDAVRIGDRTMPDRPTHVTLAPGARSVALTFTSAALGGTLPTFEARLVGGSNDEAWYATSGRAASFASLAPGSYSIEVRARDGLGRTSDPLRLAVDVPPRFVETNAFRVLAAFVVAALVLAFGWLRLRAVERARRKLEEIVTERTADLRAALEDLKKAETDLVRAEKMASVATLVRGIAHELNNPLGFVTGNVVPLRKYVEFLLGAIREVGAGAKKVDDVRLSPSKDLAFVERDLKKLLADMEEGGRRAKLIVGDLQGLTNVTSRSVEAVDVARVVEQSLRLLAPSKPEGVTIDVDAAVHETVLARAGEIEQAVVVLVDNALRAVGPKGTVSVRLAKQDDAWIVTVKDDGPGMNEDVRKRATEPFFTTRPPGEGSGLGLAIASQIAAHHRGSLSIESAPGAGTTVRLAVRNVT